MPSTHRGLEKEQPQGMSKNKLISCYTCVTWLKYNLLPKSDDMMVEMVTRFAFFPFQKTVTGNK